MAAVIPSAQETPFKIQISDESIQHLKHKLELTRFPDELEDAGRDYGVPLADIQRLVARWRDGYDWRQHERQLNEDLPQFKRDIQIDGFGTLGIHYIHMKSEVSDAIPLLFVHGWPGSFLEAKKILPLLVKVSPGHPSFHVVALSLPGYGFSDAPKRSGLGVSQCAEVGNKLMLSLGYEQYVTQGGDWGYIITRRIANLYGGIHSKAWHTNIEIRPGPPRPLSSPKNYFFHLFSRYTPAEKAGLERTNWFATHGLGYLHEQSTQPQTLGYGLADSPAGLLAWIYEKLVNWSDAYPWEDDEILTWISIYWFSSAGPAASVRLYYERAKEGGVFAEEPMPHIPHGFSRFPKDLALFPRSWILNPYLVFESEHDGGGHFAAYEKPVELVEDLRKMFGKGCPAFGVVKGHTGY